MFCLYIHVCFLVNNRVAGDDHLLGFTSWRDSPCVLIRMLDATVSLKINLSHPHTLLIANFISFLSF